MFYKSIKTVPKLLLLQFFLLPTFLFAQWEPEVGDYLRPPGGQSAGDCPYRDFIDPMQGV
jgi:hypothetical protein